jgi:uncharacterized protein
VLVLLPPSETKRPGGDGPLLDLGTLAAPELGPVRTELVEALVKLADDVPAARAALGLSAAQDGEIERNAALWTGPTLPAVDRYTGVLYDALDVGSLTRAQRTRAAARLAVGSALFGFVRAEDRIPAYRLSAGSVLPGLPTLRALWKPVLSPVLAGLEGLVVDVRSGAYAALAPAPGAVTVRVLSERPDGSRGRSSATSTKRTRAASRGCSRRPGPSRTRLRGCAPCSDAPGCTWNRAATRRWTSSSPRSGRGRSGDGGQVIGNEWCSCATTQPPSSLRSPKVTRSRRSGERARSSGSPQRSSANAYATSAPAVTSSAVSSNAAPRRCHSKNGGQVCR